MRGNLLNGTPASKAGDLVDLTKARAAAAAAVTAATGLPTPAALAAVGAALASLQKSGLATVNAVELVALGKTLDAMRYTLAHAYLVIDEHETDRGDDRVGASEAGIAILELIEATLGGKPQRPAQAPN
jgi:hypothetical protein